MVEIKKDIKKKQIDLKSLFIKNKKLVLTILSGTVACIIIVILVISLVKDNDKKNGNSNNTNGNKDNENAIYSDDDTVKDEYGFSKEDAINVIKKIYNNSENYNFTAKARKDNMYEVTVTSHETKKADVYVVDPNDGSFTYMTDIKED